MRHKNSLTMHYGLNGLMPNTYASNCVLNLKIMLSNSYLQGDQERKQLQITPPASMDREREHELPQLQIRWVNDICLPLYQVSVRLSSKCDEN